MAYSVWFAWDVLTRPCWPRTSHLTVTDAPDLATAQRALAKQLASFRASDCPPTRYGIAEVEETSDADGVNSI